MHTNTYHVLFICTANTARSILAEALMNSLGRGRFVAHSAGSRPKGAVNPLTLHTLEALRLPTDGYRSKSWEEFARHDAPRLDFVFTVCDDAAGEACPVWPGLPVTAHWGVPDPAAVQGSYEQKAHAFMEAALTLKRRIELMLALPLDKLDAMAIRDRVRDIGTL